MCEILLVDDDRQVCELEADALRKLGFDVEVAHTLQTAVRRAAAHAFTAVATGVDLRLEKRRHPRLGQGLEFIRRLRRRGIATRVIVFTTFEGHVYREASRQVGADAYLRKNIGIEELVMWLLADSACG